MEMSATSGGQLVVIMEMPVVIGMCHKAKESTKNLGRNETWMFSA